eukprot:262592-Pelagomonas_calceolata.AAC.1
MDVRNFWVILDGSRSQQNQAAASSLLFQRWQQERGVVAITWEGRQNECPVQAKVIEVSSDPPGMNCTSPTLATAISCRVHHLVWNVRFTVENELKTFQALGEETQ